MQTLTLNLSDDGMDKVMAFLNELPSEDVQVVESPIKSISNKTMSLDELYGILAPYSEGRLSDDEIENAIAQGAYESGMAGKENE